MLAGLLADVPWAHGIVADRPGVAAAATEALGGGRSGTPGARRAR